MRKLLLFLLLIICGAQLSAQPFVKGTGIRYDRGVPTVAPDTTYGTEFVYDLNDRTLYMWNRATEAWDKQLNTLRGSGAPSGTCGTAAEFYVNTTNNDLYWCSSGSWTKLNNQSSGGGSPAGSANVFDTTFTNNYTANMDSTINRLTGITEANDIVIDLPLPTASTLGISYRINQVDRNNDSFGFILVQSAGSTYDYYYSGNLVEFISFTPDTDESYQFETILLDGSYRWIVTKLIGQTAGGDVSTQQLLDSISQLNERLADTSATLRILTETATYSNISTSVTGFQSYELSNNTSEAGKKKSAASSTTYSNNIVWNTQNTPYLCIDLDTAIFVVVNNYKPAGKYFLEVVQTKGGKGVGFSNQFIIPAEKHKLSLTESASTIFEFFSNGDKMILTGTTVSEPDWNVVHYDSLVWALSPWKLGNWWYGDSRQSLSHPSEDGHATSNFFAYGKGGAEVTRSGSLASSPELATIEGQTALYFPSSYIESRDQQIFKDATESAVFSILGRIRKTTTGQGSLLDDTNNNGTSDIGFNLYASSGDPYTLNIQVQNTTSNIIVSHTTTGTGDIDEWENFWITCDGTTLTANFGGVTTTVSVTGANLTTLDHTDFMNIGRASTGANEFRGYIADLVYMDKAADSECIMDFFAQSFNRDLSDFPLTKKLSEDVTPTDFAHLFAWYDFSDTLRMWSDAAKTTHPNTLTDPIYIVESKGLSKANRDLVAGNETNQRPVLDVYNGNRMVSFDGSDDYFSITHNLDFSNEWTVFIVARNTDQVNGSDFLAADGQTEFIGINGDQAATLSNPYDADSEKYKINATGTPRVVSKLRYATVSDNLFTDYFNLPAGRSDSLWLIEISRDGSEIEVSVNGKTPIRYTFQDEVRNFYDVVGKGLTGTRYLDGHFAELIIYNSAMYDSDRRRLRKYLSEKFSFAGSVQSEKVQSSIDLSIGFDDDPDNGRKTFKPAYEYVSDGVGLGYYGWPRARKLGDTIYMSLLLAEGHGQDNYGSQYQPHYYKITGSTYEQIAYDIPVFDGALVEFPSQQTGTSDHYLGVWDFHPNGDTIIGTAPRGSYLLKVDKEWNLLDSIVITGGHGNFSTFTGISVTDTAYHIFAGQSNPPKVIIQKSLDYGSTWVHTDTLYGQNLSDDWNIKEPNITQIRDSFIMVARSDQPTCRLAISKSADLDYWTTPRLALSSNGDTIQGGCNTPWPLYTTNGVIVVDSRTTNIGEDLSEGIHRPVLIASWDQGDTWYRKEYDSFTDGVQEGISPHMGGSIVELSPGYIRVFFVTDYVTGVKAPNRTSYRDFVIAGEGQIIPVLKPRQN